MIEAIWTQGTRAMDASEVLASIEAAFDGIARPKISLRQFRLTDQKGMAGTITDEEWLNAGNQRSDRRWQDVPDSEIEECDVVLAHMQAAEFQYYLPAYMRYAVRNFQLPVWKSAILGMTVSALNPSNKYPGSRQYT